MRSYPARELGLPITQCDTRAHYFLSTVRPVVMI
jgi:hypothetical protein